jgi:hypothetical protein
MQRRRAIQTGIVGLALVVALAPISPRIIERWYSAGIYPSVQRVITPITNLVPFAVFDLIFIAVVVGILALLIAGVRLARRQRRWYPLLDRCWIVVVSVAIGYLVFLAVWGMNYRRVPMTERLEMSSTVPARDDLYRLGMTSVERMNQLHARAHAQGWAVEEWRDERLLSAFHAAQQLLDDGPPVIPGRLKRTILGSYFRWTGVDGMVDPFALEVLVNPDLLPWERPFVAAHEWAHLAGFADESEASFVAWLACVRGTEAAQYSGWLYVYWQVNGDLGRSDRESLARALGEAPRRDVAAIVERLRRGQLPLLRSASWAVYDQYLRANRVEEGIRSYGEVVTLILRTRYESEYRPVRRSQVAPSP